jgi:iron complex outermembrane recepter protein
MVSILLILALVLFPPPDPPGEPEFRGVITGIVVDGETGEPLPGAAVRLRELDRGRATDVEGRFSFEDVPIRRITLSVQFIGYAPAEQVVIPRDGETIDVRIELRPSVLELADVVVTGIGRERGMRDTYQPTGVVSGRELQRSLEMSVAASIEHLPGLSQQYNGPAASQPVIRGLSGDRVLVLDDGQRTGDISTTAPDHAVAIDPVGAERIEVVRGPAGLLYGSNALGGVINVVREDVPRSMPDGVTGTFSTMGESVNNGITANLSVRIPAGTFAIRANASARTAGDTRTPLGTLNSTDARAFSGGLGVSAVRPWGYAGISGNWMEFDYGIPGEFGGVLIPGAHPGGVDAKSSRRTLRARATHVDFPGFFSTAEIDASLNHYLHDEIEGYRPDGTAIVGAHFDQLSSSGNFALRHEHDLHGHGERDIRAEGAMGLSYIWRDLNTRGAFVGTRPASEIGFAAFGYEEFQREPLRFQIGARYDWRRVSPKSDRPILVGDRSIPVRERDFGAISGSVSLLYDVDDHWTLGLNAARAFRPPAVEELLSDGPHLADFSFDIGNPELSSEFGHGADLFLRSTSSRLQFEATAFVNRISNYIYYRPTGEIDPRFRRYPVYEAASDDAMFVGADGRVQWEFARHLVVDATVGYVRATRLDEGDPLPAIPPLNGQIQLRYDTGPFYAMLGLRAAAQQNRVPRAHTTANGIIQPERPTDGYGLLNAGLGYRFDMRGMHHSVALQANNLTDRVWHDHLSRIKDVAPQPGRNIQLSYRILF